jgi:nucleoside-diphosphate-sugar epimerase
VVLAIVLGGTGFIGGEAINTLAGLGYETLVVPAPRLTWDAPSLNCGAGEVARVVEGWDLARLLKGADVVINAAGIPGTGPTPEALYGANSLLPFVVAHACEDAGVRRFIHVSSAAVQGRRSLDESDTFSPTSRYASSKCLAEQLLLRNRLTTTEVVIYRPTSVHGPGRAVTQRVRKLASSGFSMCAAPGSDPTPQVHIRNVGAACAYLASPTVSPPPIVLHPWEGWTTRAFLLSLSQREPRLILRSLASGGSRVGSFASRPSSSLSFQARRLEMLLLGQKQKPGWLDDQGVNWTRRRADWDGRSDPWTEGG